MGEKKDANEFDRLDIEVRVKLILAAAFDHLNREQVLNFLGLEVDNVSNDLIKRVDACLSNYQVEDGVYRITDKEQRQLEHEYDLRMADEKISEYYLKLYKQ